MGSVLPRKPDNSGERRRLQRERRQAEEATANARKREADEQDALRRRMRGRVSLIRNVGGELGVTETLGQ